MNLPRYRGIEISISGDGLFYTEECADLPQSLKAETYATLKGLIDKSKSMAKQEQKPGLLLSGSYREDSDISYVTVTSVVKETSLYGGGRMYAWIRRKSGDRSKENAEGVFEDIPANRKLAAEWKANKIRAKNFEKLANDAQKKMTCVTIPLIPPEPKKLTLKLKSV